jgi:tRNA pseudouridine13 synthase
VAYIHRNGACFVVKTAAQEQPRVDAFEISPTGPLFGEKYLPAEGEPGVRETALLEAADISLADFKVPGVNLNGGRRPYRIPLTDVNLNWDDGLVISFTLPPGGYATMVLHEVMKNDEPDE